MMYRVVTSKKEKKINHDLKHMKVPFLVTNQIFVPAYLSRRAKKKKKQERKKPKCPKPNFPPNTPFPKKSYSSMIVHVIFDLIGNDLQSQVMTYLWFGIRMKHFPV